MKFIDLFAGLGGFHVGLSRLGHSCVYASEQVDELRDLYWSNFGIKAAGNIKGEDEWKIPEHDILCAGFPCQPFSKAGAQVGLNDIDRGTLFYDIARILSHHKPQFFILENVPNLKNHDKGRTWETIIRVLADELGYSVESHKLSPHEFGIPQIRERLFIVGSRTGLAHFSWPKTLDSSYMHLDQVLEDNVTKPLPERELKCLEVWQEFLNRIPEEAKLPSFPIWSMEFGATYPYEQKAPFHLTKSDLDGYLGSYGQSLHGMRKKDQLERIPRYAKSKQKGGEFPKWKKTFIRQNREFYSQYRGEIDPLLPELQKMPPSWQKFEWNCQGEERNIFKNIIQFRGSGIRIKRPNYSPALVASSSTQIPIVGWKKRYISIFEGALLQDLREIEISLSETQSYYALGNAVNAKIVELIAENLVGRAEASSKDLEYYEFKVDVKN